MAGGWVTKHPATSTPKRRQHRLIAIPRSHRALAPIGVNLRGREFGAARPGTRSIRSPLSVRPVPAAPGLRLVAALDQPFDVLG